MPSVLRVALLATVVEFGGIERVLLNLLEHNTELRIQLFPILFTRIETQTNYFLKRIESLEIPHVTILVNSCKYKYLNPIKNLGEAISCFRGKQFDLIHTHGYRADIIGYIVSKYFNLPVISTCHGFTPTDKFVGAYIKLDTFLLKYFSRIIAVSEQIKKDLTNTGVDEAKIHVITNAVWNNNRADKIYIRNKIRSQMSIGNEEFVFGYVGRLSKEKGVDYLLDAFKLGLTKSYPWRLVMIGDGPCRPLLEKNVRDMDLLNKVLFAGFQSDITAWYTAMDAFVLPSLTEGTPMALLEAMANGIPSIATFVGGVPALISNGKNGILVSPADTQELLKAMHSISEDHDYRLRLSNAAFQTVQKNHDVKNWVKLINKAYIEIVQHKKQLTF